MQPLEKVFYDTKQLFITNGEISYICVALDLTMPAPARDMLCTYLGTLLGEVWNEPSQRLGRAPTRGGRLKRIGFLIMCERACR